MGASAWWRGRAKHSSMENDMIAYSYLWSPFASNSLWRAGRPEPRHRGRGLVTSVLLSLSGCIVLFGGFGCRSDAREAEKPDEGRAAPHLVFLVSEDPQNYEAHRTVPVFAESIEEAHGYRCTVIQGEGEPNAFHFPGLEAIDDADLLVVFFRRRALPSAQLDWVRSHLEAGRPLIGIRTANHAFSVRGDLTEGYHAWPEFVPEVLGCENRGYAPADPGIDVEVVPESADHPILQGIEPHQWHADGSLYLVKPLVDEQATVLLMGTSEDKTEPIAWTRHDGSSRIFYTSLGYPTSFEQPPFRQLLVNAIEWALSP